MRTGNCSFFLFRIKSKSLLSEMSLRTLKIFLISSKKALRALCLIFTISRNFNKISHPKTFESRKFGLNKK